MPLSSLTPKTGLNPVLTTCINLLHCKCCRNCHDHVQVVKYGPPNNDQTLTEPHCSLQAGKVQDCAQDSPPLRRVDSPGRCRRLPVPCLASKVN